MAVLRVWLVQQDRNAHLTPLHQQHALLGIIPRLDHPFARSVLLDTLALVQVPRQLAAQALRIQLWVRPLVQAFHRAM
jgi:hypothetical protein